jgi:hypothetical protein
MSDYNNRDPYNPTPPLTPGGPMPGGPYDQYGNARFEPMEPSGRGPYVLLGLLVAIGIIGGLVYFNHAPRDRNAQTAQAPISATTPAPAPLGSTLPGNPATPNNPSGQTGPGAGGMANPTPAPTGAGGTNQQ